MSADDMYTPFDYETIDLERIEFGLTQEIDTKMVANLNLSSDVYLSRLRDRIIFEVRGYVWGKQIDKTEIEYPLGWWQALRERFAPQWAKDRWPIKYKTITVESRALFTDLVLPDNQYNAVLQVVRDDGVAFRTSGMPSAGAAHPPTDDNADGVE